MSRHLSTGGNALESLETLESKTVAELKQLCKDRNIKGFSKLKKEELIQAILSGDGQGTGLQQPGPTGLDSRINVKTVHSREESDEKVQHDKKLLEQRAAVAGVPVSLVKEGQGEDIAAPSPKKKNPAKPAATKPPATTKASAAPADPPGRIVSSSPGRIVSSSPGRAVPPAAGRAASTASVPPAKDNVAPEPKFQDLPAGEQSYILRNRVTKSTLSLLKLRKADFLKMKAKKLEEILDALEIEKGRFTVYNPTEKMLRGFIDESITLINEVREEQLNVVESRFLTHDLPKHVKKNEKKIKSIIARVDRYYTETDAARDIVEMLRMKSPFPETYWITHFKEFVLKTRGAVNQT